MALVNKILKLLFMGTDYLKYLNFHLIHLQKTK